MTDEYTLFFGPEGENGHFSNWHVHPFAVDGETFNCVEQYMMAAKAREFGDADMRAKIMKSTKPRAHKRFGRRVRGFVQNTWEKRRVSVVRAALRAKYASSTSPLGRRLLATGDRVIAEASPYDKIWGTGRAATHKWAREPAHWLGTNLLGRLLMERRDELRRTEEAVDRETPTVVAQ